MGGTISEIVYYPVKSVQGINAMDAWIEPRGLRDDRRFMLIDSNGRFITAREHPRLLLVACRFSDGGLLIESPDGANLAIETGSQQQRLDTQIWKSRVNAATVSDEADEWFSNYLGIACRLVFMDPDARRPVDQNFGRTDDEVSFADAFPILIISSGAMDGLNERLDAPLEMRRFRPNLVVDGFPAHAEDSWRRIQIGDQVELELVKHCSRCVLTTIDPRSARKHAQQEPLRTLATYRRGQGGNVYFGMNGIPRITGQIKLGDKVTVLETSSDVI